MKVVLITGASSGFGLKSVEYFLSRDWIVIATLRRLEDRKEPLFSELLREYPRTLILKELDVTKENDRSDLAHFLKEEMHSQLDVLLNNAGYGIYGAFEDFSELEIRDQLEVNYFGLALLTKELLPFLRNAKGRLINVSSILGLMGIPMGSQYAASKFALEGLSESLYYELKGRGVSVTLVEPDSHKTEFASNTKWVKESLNEQSEYFDEFAHYQKHLKETLRSKGNDPMNTVRKIYRAATMEKPPLRMTAGRMSAALAAVKKILPERIFLGMMEIYSRQALGAKKQAES